MSFAGVDFSTNAIDVVLLNEDTDHATWEHVRLAEPPAADAFGRARRVRDLMPARGRWADAGVVLIAMEKPMGQHRQSIAGLMRVQGAILACLPVDIPVLELTPQQWKGETVGKGNASKDDVRAWALARWRTSHLHRNPTQDALDAYAIAWAARAMCERAPPAVAA